MLVRGCESRFPILRNYGGLSIRVGVPCPCPWGTPRVEHAEHQIDYDRNEAVQLHTIAIITKFLSRVVNKAMQLFCTI
jgi:hypothetical protein